MVNDRRERIMVRLEEIAATVPGVVLAGRNVIDPPDDQLPAVVVFEGDEEVDERDEEYGVGGDSIVRMHMTPHFVISAMTPPGEVVDSTDGALVWTDKLGTMLNTMRRVLLKAVLTDAALAGIFGSNGRVVPRGQISDFQPGSATIGRVSVLFRIVYPLMVTEL